MRLLFRVFDNKPCYLDLQADTVILVSSKFPLTSSRAANLRSRLGRRRECAGVEARRVNWSYR